jgi:hypothetical protein
MKCIKLSTGTGGELIIGEKELPTIFDWLDEKEPLEITKIEMSEDKYKKLKEDFEGF